MQANRKELIHNFKQVLSVEATLWQKTLTVVNAQYITALGNHNTNSVKNTTDVILNNIFNTCGKITPQMLTQCKGVVKQINFDVDALIDTVSKTVIHWGMYLPQISIPKLNSSISTWFITLSIKLDDTIKSFRDGIEKIQKKKLGMHSNHIFALTINNFRVFLKNCGGFRFSIKEYLAQVV